MTLHQKSSLKQYCITVIMLSKVILITLSKEELLTKCHYLWILKWSLCQKYFTNLLWSINFLSKLSHTVTLSKMQWFLKCKGAFNCDFIFYINNYFISSFISIHFYLNTFQLLQIICFTFILIWNLIYFDASTRLFCFFKYFFGVPHWATFIFIICM